MKQQASYPIVDLHCDTMTGISRSGGKDRLAQRAGHIDLPRLQAGGALMQCFAIFAAAQPLTPAQAPGYTPKGVFEGTYTQYLREMDENRSQIAPVYRFGDIGQNRQAGRISSLLTLEDGAVVHSLDDLQALYDKGVRMLGFTWNFPNGLGNPNSPDPAAMELGLTELGREAVGKMESLGMVVDVSHLSDGGFWEIVRLARKPFLASHSNARALCPHPRNLTDPMLRALADKGGATGLNFCSRFVDGSDYTSVEGLLRHALHIRDVAGIEALCLGSDFDGIDSRLEFEDYSGYPRLLAAFEKHFTPRELDLITHGNALRVFGACMEA